MLLAGAISSCTWFNNKGGTVNESPLARVGNAYLYPSDVEGLLKPGISRGDSALFVSNYINSWVRKQLILEKAENYLPDTKEIEKQVEDYRATLLIYEYQSGLLSQNIDTAITEEELSTYYDEHSEDFILDDDLFNIHYAMFDINFSQRDSVRLWIKSENPADKEDLRELSSRLALSYALEPTWVKRSTLEMRFPFPSMDLTNYFKHQKYPVLEDSDYVYFLKLIDQRRKEDIAPLDYVREEIKQMILTQRKNDYLNKLNDDIYKDATQPRDYEIYNQQ